MRKRNLAMAFVAIFAILAAVFGNVSTASATVRDQVTEKVPAASASTMSMQRMAQKGSFSCEGKSYNYGYWFYLQGSGQRVAYMVGVNNGRYAVRMWRPNGASNAYYAIGSLGTGGALVAGPQYEYCNVRPSGANGAHLWARIPNVGTWEEDVRFS